jgi:hypothetical protein
MFRTHQLSLKLLSWQANCRANVVGQALRLPRQAQSLPYNLIRRNRSAFTITETELKLIAAPAIIGLRRRLKNG